MRNYHPENERLKRWYLAFIKETKGQDHKSTDKIAAALVKFEESTKYKPFKAFHIEQARQFKTILARAKNPRTGQPLSLTTIDATLRMVKGFFGWLSLQQGFKKVLSFADAEYFDNSAKDARAAHSARQRPHPNLQAPIWPFRLCWKGSEIAQRNKALFAFFMLTGVRVKAAATLTLKHINLADGTVFSQSEKVSQAVRPPGLWPTAAHGSGPE